MLAELRTLLWSQKRQSSKRRQIETPEVALSLLTPLAAKNRNERGKEQGVTPGSGRWLLTVTLLTSETRPMLVSLCSLHLLPDGKPRRGCRGRPGRVWKFPFPYGMSGDRPDRVTSMWEMARHQSAPFVLLSRPQGLYLCQADQLSRARFPTPQRGFITRASGSRNRTTWKHAGHSRLDLNPGFCICHLSESRFFHQ